MSTSKSWRVRAVVSLGAAVLSGQAFATVVAVCPTCTTEAQVNSYAYSWALANFPQHYGFFIVTSPAPYTIQKCYQRINTFSPPNFYINTISVQPTMANCPNPGPPLG